MDKAETENIERQLNDAAAEREFASDDISRQFAAVKGRMSSLETTVEGMKKDLEKNSELTSKVNEGTSELLEIIKAGKGFFKFTSLVGKVFTWFGGIAAACVAVWALVKNIKGG